MAFALRADKDELKKTIACAFERKGWKISTPGNAFLDIELNQNGVKFFVQCMDRAILDFNSMEHIIDEAEETSRVQASIKKTGVVYVFNFTLTVSFLDLLKRGIIAFHLDELPYLVDLDKRFVDLSFLEDARLSFMASNVLGLSLIVSNSYCSIGDMPNAIEWARRGVAAGRGFSKAYRKLFELLMKVKDYEAAEQVMLNGMALQPSNLEVLESLIKLAKIQTDLEKAASYERRLKAIMVGENVRINNFSELVKRTQTSPEHPVFSCQNAKPTSAKSVGGALIGLLRRKPP
jgi:hypothetical protein